MLKSIPYSHIYFYLICGVIIGVFFSPAINSISTGLLLLNWLVEGKFRTKWNALKNNKAVWTIIAIFLIHILGLLYTSNFQYALKDLRIKLPILILPVVFASSAKISMDDFLVLLKVLVFTALASSLYSFYIYLRYYGNVIVELRAISTIISHIRLSLLNCLAAFACFYLIFKNNYKKATLINVVWFLIAAWLFIFNGILGARMGILVFLVLIILGVFYISIKKKKLWLSLILITAALSLPFISYYGIKSVKMRVDEGINELRNYQHGGDPSGQSISQRFVFWEIGYHIFKKSPLIGIGTGDVADEYKKFYAQNDVIDKKFQHRAHNQYLTILLTFGIIGFVVFMIGVIYPLFWNRKYLDYFYVVFIVSFLLSMTMEDTIETQAGVTFYAFFNSLFLFVKPDEQL